MWAGCALYRMARELAESVIERHRQRRQGRARRITIDLDPTDDPTARGATARLLQRVLRHVVLSAAAGVRDVRPRSGAVPLCGGAAVRQGGSLRGSGGPVVAVAAAVALRVSAGRGSSFGSTRALRHRRSSTSWMPARGSTTSSRCRRTPCCWRHAERPWLGRGRAARAAADNRARLRRDPLCGRLVEAIAAASVVTAQAEVVRLAGREPRDNPRFVVTNLGRPPRSLYEKVYCARGDIENRIKELLDEAADRLRPTLPFRLDRRGPPCGFRRSTTLGSVGRCPGILPLAQHLLSPS